MVRIATKQGQITDPGNYHVFYSSGVRVARGRVGHREHRPQKLRSLSRVTSMYHSPRRFGVVYRKFTSGEAGCAVRVFT